MNTPQENSKQYTEFKERKGEQICSVCTKWFKPKSSVTLCEECYMEGMQTANVTSPVVKPEKYDIPI